MTLVQHGGRVWTDWSRRAPLTTGSRHCPTHGLTSSGTAPPVFRYGTTGRQDAIGGACGGAGDILAAYRRADAEGRLRRRATGAPWWDRERGREQAAGEVVHTG